MSILGRPTRRGIDKDKIEVSIRLLSAADILPLVAEMDFSKGVRDDLLSDADCGPPLRAYLALTDSHIGGELSAAELFCNRYFWFCRFAHSAQQVFGYDAGIEQQAFQVIENADCETDAALLEQLETAARTKSGF